MRTLVGADEPERRPQFTVLRGSTTTTTTAIDWGRVITDAINADPAEVERLRRSRWEARHYVSRLWAEDWNSAEDSARDDDEETR